MNSFMHGFSTELTKQASSEETAKRKARGALKGAGIGAGVAVGLPAIIAALVASKGMKRTISKGLFKTMLGVPALKMPGKNASRAEFSEYMTARGISNIGRKVTGASILTGGALGGLLG